MKNDHAKITVVPLGPGSSELLTFQSFGKSPRRNNPRRAICASLNGGAAVDNGDGD
jgi:hypothetical protein